MTTEQTRGKIDRAFEEHLGVTKKAREYSDAIASIATEAVATLRAGGKIILFGNGGSAADAQHIAAELVSRFMFNRRPLCAIALTTNTSALTAIANDISFDEVFSRQLEAIAASGDLVVGLSTSGRSRNVLKAIEHAKERGLKTIGLTGAEGGQLARISDISIMVPSAIAARIQEVHIFIGHVVCELVEEEMLGKEQGRLHRS
jgi:D-sedoheptulose 7-phosphate isomerase